MSEQSYARAGADAPLVLFVTGDAPRSRRARDNLRQALAALGLDQLEPREIDLIAHPEQTVAWGVFATPALVKPAATGTGDVIYGDLSDTTRLERFLADIDTSAD